jgi:hypothetical protein
MWSALARRYADGGNHYLASIAYGRAKFPCLACVLIYNAFTNLYRDAMYHGGIFSMGFFNFWTVDNVRASAAIGGGTPPRPGGVANDVLYVASDQTDTAFFVKISEQQAVPRVKELVMDVVARDVPPPSTIEEFQRSAKAIMPTPRFISSRALNTAWCRICMSSCP